MGYISKGYSIVYLSPVLSFFAMLFLFAVGLRIVTDWFHQTVLFALVQLLLISIQVLGLACCFAGFKRNESIPDSMFKIVFLSAILLLWGVFTVFLALGSYSDLLWWSHQPEVRSLTIWDHLDPLTWAFKGSLWIFAAIVLPMMASIRKRLTQEHA
jgi:hypothetical protein